VKAVLAVSQAVREELVNVSGVPSLLVRPVLGGIDLARYPADPEPPSPATACPPSAR
jgi:hypothetical protein